MMDIRLPGLLLAASLALAVAPARAHSHVRVTARSELIFAPDGTLTRVRHAWSFDKTFSAEAVEGLESAIKGRYSRDELAPLAQLNVEALKEYAYFTVLRANGRRERFEEPVDYFADYRDGVLTLHFSLPLRVPVLARQMVMEVSDRTAFTAFEMTGTDPVSLVGAPAGCRITLERPPDGAARGQSHDEPLMADDDAEHGKAFVSKVTVDCP